MCVIDCLLFLSSDSFDLVIALSTMKVPAKRGIVCVPDTFTLHIDQQRVLMHSTTLLNFLLLAKSNINVILWLDWLSVKHLPVSW